MAKGADTRRRILQGARELIHARSYNAVGVLQICTRAKVKKGSFYYFFPSKQALALEMVDGMWAEEDADVLTPAYGDGLPPLRRIARHAELRHAVSLREQSEWGAVLGCPFGALATELAAEDPEMRDKVAQMLRRVAALIEQALNDAVSAGDVPELDAAAAATVLLAQLLGAGVMSAALNDPAPYLSHAAAVEGVARAHAVA